jgi:hypothetical protein
MRLPILSAAFAALCLAVPAAAQVQVHAGNGTCAASTAVFFGEKVMGGMQITYNQPPWKEENEAKIEQAKGHLNRLGMNWWSMFNTSVDVEIGGTKVPAGCYVLGLDCSKDGKWSLALLDASKAMKAGAMPFPVDEKGTMNWKPEILAPLEHKNDAKTVAEKMTMTLELSKDLKGSYTLAWGKHTLTAAMTVVQK